MGKPRINGMNKSCIPNRYADMRRRNNAYKKGIEFADNDWLRGIAKRERKLMMQKEEFDGKT